MAADPGAEALDGALEALLLKLRARDLLNEQEERVLRGSVAEIREVGAGRNIVRAGVTLGESLLLVEGIVARFKDLADGQRQIMEFHVAGDFIDLHGFLLKRLEHNLGAMTPVRLAIVPHERLRQITEDYPHLSRMLWFSTLVDAAIHREHIVSIGRRTALSRIAHLLCELYVRLEVVGQAAEGRFQLPLTQADIADVTGLTSVHVNRMLKSLRDDELLTFRNAEVIIHDWEQLRRIAEFSGDYLYLERRPR